MVIGHTIGSIFFAFGHFALMVALRIPWYALNGRAYVWREPFVNNLIVEYQKVKKIWGSVCVPGKILGVLGLEVYSPATPRAGVKMAKGGGLILDRRTSHSANCCP